MSAGRKLIVDSSLNARRIPSELKKRGRDAVGLYELGWDKYKDPPLLEALATEFPDAVLITADDKMPLTHGAIIAKLGSTVATLEPWNHNPSAVRSMSPETSDQEAYEHETVHRWVHRIEVQESSSVRRYFVASASRLWTPRFA